MRLRAFILAAVMAGVQPGQAHPPPVISIEQEKSFADEILAWRKAFADAASRKDAKRLHNFYASSFVHVDAEGKQTGRDQRVAEILAGVPVIELAPVRDLVIRVPGGWTAIATGRSILQAGSDRKPQHVGWMAVYVRAGDGWQLAASHVTQIVAPPP